jgi:4-hydroxyphenylpyruvate dioxygenase
MGVRDIFETVELLRSGVSSRTPRHLFRPDRQTPAQPRRGRGGCANRILIDGSDEDGLLLQIFTQDTFGPIFFEIIQRKGNQAFGEGNFQALFDSIELDQIRRGVIKVEA